MQTNSMKQALARGETQVGVWINMVRNPAILRLMKSAGLDFARKVIDEYRTRLIEAARRHGKDVSMLVGSIEQGEQWIRAGAKIICYSSEVEILRRGIMEAAARLHAVR